MNLLNFNNLKRIFSKKYYNSLKDEFMNLNKDLNKILDAFNQVKTNCESKKENLLLEKAQAVKVLDIDKIKEIDEKLKNIN